jgi:hypothetical protein
MPIKHVLFSHRTASMTAFRDANGAAADMSLPNEMYVRQVSFCLILTTWQRSQLKTLILKDIDGYIN